MKKIIIAALAALALVTELSAAGCGWNAVTLTHSIQEKNGNGSVVYTTPKLIKNQVGYAKSIYTNYYEIVSIHDTSAYKRLHTSKKVCPHSNSYIDEHKLELYQRNADAFAANENFLVAQYDKDKKKLSAMKANETARLNMARQKEAARQQKAAQKRVAQQKAAQKRVAQQKAAQKRVAQQQTAAFNKKSDDLKKDKVRKEKIDLALAKEKQLDKDIAQAKRDKTAEETLRYLKKMVQLLERMASDK